MAFFIIMFFVVMVLVFMKTNSCGVKKERTKSSMFWDIYICFVVFLVTIPLFIYLSGSSWVKIKENCVTKHIKANYTQKQKEELNEAIDDYNKVLKLVRGYRDIEGKSFKKVK